MSKVQTLHDALYKELTQGRQEKDSDEELVAAFERALDRQEEHIKPREKGTYFEAGEIEGEEDDWL